MTVDPRVRVIDTGEMTVLAPLDVYEQAVWAICSFLSYGWLATGSDMLYARHAHHRERA
jgi:hypothetical protein